MQGGSEASRRRAGEVGEAGEAGEAGERSASAGRFPFQSHEPIKKILESVPVSCEIQEAAAPSSSARARKARRPTPLPPPLRLFERKGRRDGGTAGRPTIRGPRACTRRFQSKTARACLVVLLWVFLCPLGLERKKNRPVDLRLISG